MQNNNELAELKQLLILNFIELQEIKQRLNIADQDRPDPYEFPNSINRHIEQLDKKLGVIRTRLDTMKP
jgi:hypothetical protein